MLRVMPLSEAFLVLSCVTSLGYVFYPFPNRIQYPARLVFVRGRASRGSDSEIANSESLFTDRVE